MSPLAIAPKAPRTTSTERGSILDALDGFAALASEAHTAEGLQALATDDRGAGAVVLGRDVAFRRSAVSLDVTRRRKKGSCLRSGKVVVVAVVSCDDARATHAHVMLVEGSSASGRPFAEKRARLEAQTSNPLHPASSVTVAHVEFDDVKHPAGVAVVATPVSNDALLDCGEARQNLADAALFDDGGQATCLDALLRTFYARAPKPPAVPIPGRSKNRAKGYSRVTTTDFSITGADDDDDDDGGGGVELAAR